MSTSVRIFDLPILRSAVFANSFTYRGMSVWNQLPPEIREATSVHSFKSCIYKHVFATDNHLLISYFLLLWTLLQIYQISIIFTYNFHVLLPFLKLVFLFILFIYLLCTVHHMRICKILFFYYSSYNWLCVHAEWLYSSQMICIHQKICNIASYPGADQIIG